MNTPGRGTSNEDSNLARQALGPTLARYLIFGACLVIIVAGMQAAAPVLSPVLLALFIAIQIGPLLKGLQRMGMPGWLAILILLLALLVIGSALIFILYSSMAALADRLPEYADSLKARGAGLALWLTDKGIDVFQMTPADVIDPSAVAGTAVSALRTLVGGVATAFLILAIVLFMLGEAPGLSTKLNRVLRPGDPFLANFVEFSQSIQRQIRVQTAGSFVISSVFALGLFILGVDFPLLWWILTFILGYIPNIGLAIAAVPPTLLAFIQNGVGAAAIVLVLVIVLNLFWDNAVSPRLVGMGLNLSPVVVFLSVIFWSWVFGIMGALLAVPLTVFLKLVLQSARDTRWLADLMSAHPQLATPDTPKTGTRKKKRG